MLRHAEAAVEHGIVVEMIGFAGERLPEAAAGVRTTRIPGFEWMRSRAPGARVAVAAARQAMLALVLAARLLTKKRPSTILLQTPPLLPAAPLLFAYAWLVRARLVLDWHNSTAAMLEKRFGRNGLTRIVAAIERRAARTTRFHLAVSSHMAAFIGPDAAILRDRAPARFTPGVRKPGANAPALFVVPSSFSIDDDFDLFLDALRECDGQMTEPGRATIVLTGYGERRVPVMRSITRLALTRVTVTNEWLSEAGFVAVLQSADAGISLHRSASGLDLPIKIEEFLACGTTVLALDYGGALDEVEAPILRFRSAGELASLMLRVIGGTEPAPPFTEPSWSDEWSRVALPLIV